MTAAVGEGPGPAPLVEGRKSVVEQSLVIAFMVIPVLALGVGVVLAWERGGITVVDIAIAACTYVVTGLGVTVGFHRYFTHGSFRAVRPLRIGLAVAGSLAMQGSVVGWVADHRRHHAYSDKEGDPHSPWLFGTGPVALARGFWHAHLGWLFDRDRTNARRFAPDLLADPDIAAVDRSFVLLTAVSLGGPAAVGGLVTWSWWGASTALLWGGLVRVGLLHHVTWSINSICHMVGERPFASRDRSANVWWLAVLSFGESWHNLHHADPTCARHGVGRGQVDISAGVIRIFERWGWAYAVRWPTRRRLERLARVRRLGDPSPMSAGRTGPSARTTVSNSSPSASRSRRSEAARATPRSAWPILRGTSPAGGRPSRASPTDGSPRHAARAAQPVRGTSSAS